MALLGISNVTSQKKSIREWKSERQKGRPAVNKRSIRIGRKEEGTKVPELKR